MDSIVGATNACKSTSTGREPSIDTATAEPAAPGMRPESRNSEGLGTSSMPACSMRNTPISLTEPKRFLAARRMRYS